MRWYYAESELSERWTYAADDHDVAIEEGIGNFGGHRFAIAPEENIPDSRFYAELASAIAFGFESVDEVMGENGFVDFEDAFLEGTELGKKLERKLAEWLPSVVKRPGWRTIDTGKAETIIPEDLEQ